MRIQKLSILIPAYNEAKTIRNVLQNVSDLKLYKGILKEIIVINDCPTDSTIYEIELFQSNEKDIEESMF
jgi:glycosyltransferase involved in cell wall biosynthesis